MMAAAPPHDSTTDENAANRLGNSEQPSPAAARTNRHAEFYFTDEMTVFQVENRLFRVHRHFLAEDSPIFSSMFSLPRGAQDCSTAAPEGTSDANPIYLAGVTELEFETLLRFIYKSIYEGFTLPQESWIVLLSIAHRYDFLNVRERAIREIYGPFRALQERWAKMKSVEKRREEMEQELQQHDYQLLISVAEKYNVPLRHIVPLLLLFVVREQPLTEGEISGISALTLSKIAHAREDFQRERGSKGGVSALGTKEIVYRIWQVENYD